MKLHALRCVAIARVRQCPTYLPPRLVTGPPRVYVGVMGCFATVVKRSGDAWEGTVYQRVKGRAEIAILVFGSLEFVRRGSELAARFGRSSRSSRWPVVGRRDLERLPALLHDDVPAGA